MKRWRNRLFFLSATVAAIAGVLTFISSRPGDAVERQPLALMTSLPIYWSEGRDIASLVSGDASLPWVREAIERKYELSPIDSFSGNDGSDPLDSFDRLLIAQPRGLSPEDNVALDEWVRGGGRLIYVIDPMLTGHYSVSFSDPRHPTAIGLVPPVLVRWGLGLRFDDSQPFELRQAGYGTDAIPVQMAGEIILLPDDGSATAEERNVLGDCTILGDAVIATCRIGLGRALVVADAALFEMHQADAVAENQLMKLLEIAFERTN